MNSIEHLRKQKGITQGELGAAIGVTKTAISYYENEKRQLTADILQKLAEYFGVSTDEILGLNESKQEPIGKPIDPAEFPPQTLTRQPLPDLEKETALIPILGSVRAGYDYIAEEEMLGWLKVEPSFKAMHPQAFALYVKGDSMSPEIHHNDIAVCLPDQEIRDNDVAVICVNGDEGTVKRVRFEDNGLTLLPANPRYKAHRYTPEDVESLPVILRARVVEVRHQYK
ncbi:MAG: helix-turn-helix domain-containing protein [Clostridia bacterium]|nr:helix-turn-helix domain-containing protein [Clostridia bacterium]